LVYSAVVPAELYTAPGIRRCASYTIRTAPRASIDRTDTEPIVQCRARCRARCRAVRRALIERLHRSRDWSKNRIKPEPRYQYVTVTKSKQSTVVKLEPSTGPTLFLNQTTTNRSTTATAIRIQYCASCTTRTDTAARKGPIQGQRHDIGKQAPRNGKAVYEEALTKMLCKRTKDCIVDTRARDIQRR
jgi:hypothetical protein